MIYVLATCSGSIKGITSAVKAIVNILQIIAPILLIISITMSIIKILINPDDKKIQNGKTIITATIATVLVYFIPLLVTVALSFADENNSFAECWKNGSTTTSNTNTNYVDTYDDNQKSSIITEDDYEKGKAKKDNN